MSDIFYTPAQTDWIVTASGPPPDSDNRFNLYDRDFDSQWEVTGASSATQAIWLDRGEIPVSGSYAPIDAIVMVFYSGSYADLGPSANLDTYQHVRLDTVGKVGRVSSGFSTYFDDDKQIFLRELPSPYILRYMNFQFQSFIVDPVLTQIMLLTKRTIPRNASIRNSHQFPRWYNKPSKLDGALKRVASTFIKPVQVYRKHYPLYGDADIGVGENIFNDCRGIQQPFVYQPGTTIADTSICRMIKDTARISEQEQDHKEQVFEFEEIYFIKSGFNT